MGKKVKCLDDGGVYPNIIRNAFYEVDFIVDSGVRYQLVDVPGTYNIDRFEDVEEDGECHPPLPAPIGSIVTCIDESNLLDCGDLVLGQDYKVTGIALGNHYHLKGVRTAYLQRRFKLKSVAGDITDKSKTDIEEDRCWALLRPRIESHECICGIAKVQCSYHR